MISDSASPTKVATMAPPKIGAMKRWNEMPEALAAVISLCRVKPPTVKTVAKSTAAGSTRNIVSGMPST